MTKIMVARSTTGIWLNRQTVGNSNLFLELVVGGIEVGDSNWLIPLKLVNRVIVFTSLLQQHIDMPTHWSIKTLLKALNFCMLVFHWQLFLTSFYLYFKVAEATENKYSFYIFLGSIVGTIIITVIIVSAITATIRKMAGAK